MKLFCACELLTILSAFAQEESRSASDNQKWRIRKAFENGELNLGGICLVAGLGPENNHRRDGSLAYYLSEPVVRNDAKGVAPFLMCYTEIKRLDA